MANDKGTLELDKLVERSIAVAKFCALWAAQAPDEAASKAAASLRSRVGADGPPYGLTELLTLYKGSVRDASIKSSRGRLRATPHGWEVDLNPRVSWLGNRFTLAHELGHILLYDAVAADPDMIRDLQRPELHSAIERLCDRVAIHVLVPADDVRAQLARRPLHGVADLEALIDLFAASPIAVLRQVPQVDPATSLVTWTHRRHRDRPADWRVEHQYRGAKASEIYSGISRRFVRPDVIDMAASTGFARHHEGTIDVGGKRHSGEFIAYRRGQRSQLELPVFRGVPIPDEPELRTIYMLFKQVSSGPISRRQKFG